MGFVKTDSKKQRHHWAKALVIDEDNIQFPLSIKQVTSLKKVLAQNVSVLQKALDENTSKSDKLEDIREQVTQLRQMYFDLESIEYDHTMNI